MKLISELHVCIFDYLEIDWEAVDAWIMREGGVTALDSHSQTAERHGGMQ